MNSANDNPYIRSLYDHALKNGFSEDWLFCEKNHQEYINTALDAYKDYALFTHLFKGRFDEEILAHVMTVDFRSRLGSTAGISGSERYESVMLVEPPDTRRTGMADYFNVARPGDFKLLLKPVIYRLENFENYAREKREKYIDERTWYIYIFATKKKLQRKGYGKRLMQEMTSFADENDYRLCLETNDGDNVGMYEHFGFRMAEKSMYQNTLEHYNMVYEAG